MTYSWSDYYKVEECNLAMIREYVGKFPDKKKELYLSLRRWRNRYKIKWGIIQTYMPIIVDCLNSPMINYSTINICINFKNPEEFVSQKDRDIYKSLENREDLCPDIDDALEILGLSENHEKKENAEKTTGPANIESTANLNRNMDKINKSGSIFSFMVEKPANTEAERKLIMEIYNKWGGIPPLTTKKPSCQKKGKKRRKENR